MSKLPSVSSNKIIKRLLKAGFDYAPIKGKGSHIVTPKPHEILAFLIVSSINFNSWFDEYIRKLIPQYSKVINLSKVAEYIIGYSQDPQKKYLADIINGPMDADKLDYLARDAKFSGLRIGYDIDRYFKTINIHRRTIDDSVIVRLGVPLSGVNSLEQMIVGKMTFYSSIYHHQKVRCAERMFELLCDYVSVGRVKGGELNIKHPINFLDPYSVPFQVSEKYFCRIWFLN